jgi:hypothetical protein
LGVASTWSASQTNPKKLGLYFNPNPEALPVDPVGGSLLRGRTVHVFRIGGNGTASPAPIAGGYAVSRGSRTASSPPAGTGPGAGATAAPAGPLSSESAEMGTGGKVLLGVAGLAAVVVLFIVLRPADAEETTTTTAATTDATTSQTGETDTEPGDATTAPTTEPEEPEGPQTIRLDVKEAEPEIERVDVERGERVVLVVRADVTDHVHLHGYDLMSEVGPGRPARLEFRASIPGQFEVELEDRHRQIAQLTVTQ